MPHDNDLLSLLGIRVKIISCEQVAKLYFGHLKNPTLSAKKLLNKLSNSGLIELSELSLCRLPRLNSPVYSSLLQNVDDVDFGALGWQFEKRLSATLIPTQIATITKKGTRLVGGRVPQFRRAQATHDLMVTEIALRYDDQTDLVREDFLHEHGFSSPLPDLLALPSTVIEIGGRYTKERIEQLILAFTNEGYEFQLW